MLSLSNNRIEVVEEQLLRSNTNLKEIYLDNNQIKLIEPKQFDAMGKLELVDFEGNVCVSAFYEGQKLAEMKRVLRENCMFVGFIEPLENL
jgi:Leucine-rich repeat (LRR) protein